MYRDCRTACDGDGRDRARIVDLLGNAEIKRQLSENAGPHPFRLPAENRKGPPLRTADEEELHRGPALQAAIFRHRPRDRGTRRRPCHPVRVLRAGRADIEGASRFTYRRFRFATLHLGHETGDGYPPETVFAHPAARDGPIVPRSARDPYASPAANEPSFASMIMPACAAFLPKRTCTAPTAELPSNG